MWDDELWDDGQPLSLGQLALKTYALTGTIRLPAPLGPNTFDDLVEAMKSSEMMRAYLPRAFAHCTTPELRAALIYLTMQI